MYIEVTESRFIQDLRACDPTFSYAGAKALFNYLEDINYQAVDYVELRCEFSEQTLQAISDYYNLVDRDDYLISGEAEEKEYDDEAYASDLVAALENETTVITVNHEKYPTLDSVYVYANF